jgi:hypothetical protein
MEDISPSREATAITLEDIIMAGLQQPLSNQSFSKRVLYISSRFGCRFSMPMENTPLEMLDYIWPDAKTVLMAAHTTTSPLLMRETVKILGLNGMLFSITIRTNLAAIPSKQIIDNF